MGLVHRGGVCHTGLMTKRVKTMRQIAIILGAFLFMLTYKYGTPDNELPAQSPSPVSVMFNQHKCWTNDGRVHPKAGHAVIADQAGRPFYVGQHVTDNLIREMVFGDKVTGTVKSDGKVSVQTITVVGFCE